MSPDVFSPGEHTLFAVLAAGWQLLFLSAVALLALCIRHRRIGRAAGALLLLILAYFSSQCMVWTVVRRWSASFAAVAYRFAALPRPLLAALPAVTALAEILLFRDSIPYERTHITPMSVKEAMDNLPSGICIFLPGGPMLLVNRTMEDLCRAVTGEALVSGEAFRARIRSGSLLPGCDRILSEGSTVLILPDGPAWSVVCRESSFENRPARMLFAFDITEEYGKTRALRKMQKELTALNARLAVYNREIVALTAERETLNAKIRLHDELGSALLSMKRIIRTGGSEREREELRSRLERNVSFIGAESPPSARDAYDLILETGEALGVHIRLTGLLPQTEPNKQILSTAIHECITNTLRHARGDEIRVTVDSVSGPGGERLRTVFTNNGEQPRGEIREKGGLRALRAMVESAGGTMTVRSAPDFSIVIELPKEADYAVQSFDRG